eukprot:gnl/Spiro4/26516_TR13196_c0_g1_i1.p1 gnl/Spiro4/26516_TR13196_c0_g1~~gnl/Spiro4/26516_TR13196_c0_g1_i1.p1  ORF type:complete len:1451 (-),score=397.27 gnl/Spiro4/26516_TR13196_c0_g1_i1:80-4432(-)
MDPKGRTQSPPRSASLPGAVNRTPLHQSQEQRVSTQYQLDSSESPPAYKPFDPFYVAGARWGEDGIVEPSSPVSPPSGHHPQQGNKIFKGLASRPQGRSLNRAQLLDNQQHVKNVIKPAIRESTRPPTASRFKNPKAVPPPLFRKPKSIPPPTSTFQPLDMQLLKIDAHEHTIPTSRPESPMRSRTDSSLGLRADSPLRTDRTATASPSPSPATASDHHHLSAVSAMANGSSKGERPVSVGPAAPAWIDSVIEGRISTLDDFMEFVNKMSDTQRTEAWGAVFTHLRNSGQNTRVGNLSSRSRSDHELKFHPVTPGATPPRELSLALGRLPALSTELSILATERRRASTANDSERRRYNRIFGSDPASPAGRGMAPGAGSLLPGGLSAPLTDRPAPSGDPSLVADMLQELLNANSRTEILSRLFKVITRSVGAACCHIYLRDPSGKIIPFEPAEVDDLPSDSELEHDLIADPFAEKASSHQQAHRVISSIALGESVPVLPALPNLTPASSRTISAGRGCISRVAGGSPGIFIPDASLAATEIDVHTDALCDSSVFTLVGRRANGQLIVVPIRLASVTLGVVVVHGRAQDHGVQYSQQDYNTIAILCSFAARCMRVIKKLEVETHRQRMLSAIVEISRVLSLDLEKPKLVNNIHTRVRTLLNCECVMLFVDQQTTEMAVSAISSSSRAKGEPMVWSLSSQRENGATVTQEFLLPRSSSGVVAQVLLSARKTLLDKVSAADCPDSLLVHMRNAEDFKTLRVRSLLALPVNVELAGSAIQKTVGCLVCVNKTDGFSRADEFLAEVLCSHLGVMLRNVELFQQVERARQRIEAMIDVSKALSSELELLPLIRTIMARSKELLNADRCTLFLLDRDREELWSRVSDGVKEIRIKSTQGIAGHVATKGETLNIPEAYDDPRFNKAIDTQTGYRTKTILCMPMVDEHGEVIGVTQMINKKTGVFENEDENLLASFSSQAAVAIQKAKVFQETIRVRNQLNAILTSITSLILTLDENGRLLDANRNPLNLLGVSQDEMKDASFRDWLSLNPEFVNNIQKVYLGEGEAYASDFLYRVPPHKSRKSTDNSPDDDGDTEPAADVVHTINFHVNPLHFSDDGAASAAGHWDASDGKVKGVVISCEDVTSEKKMLSTLSRYLSPTLAQQVVEQGQLLGGQKQKCSVLFADIRNFTSLSEHLDDPRYIVEVLNEYFGRMVDVIFDEEGILDKYIGDALMAVFGVPFTKDTDALRSVRAALTMRSRLHVYNAERRAKSQPPIGIGIGINTGEVVSGNIGCEKRMEYTCIGDHVNLASRLEGATKAYKIVIMVSEYTYEECKDLFAFRLLDTIRVIGKKNGVRVYEVLYALETAVQVEKPELMDWMLRDEETIFYQSANFQRGMEVFQEGRELYLACRFQDAIDKFTSVLQLVPNDGPSLVFIDRCKHLVSKPFPPDWDGVWNLDHK